MYETSEVKKCKMSVADGTTVYSRNKQKNVIRKIILSEVLLVDFFKVTRQNGFTINPQ